MIKINLMDSYKDGLDRYKARYNMDHSNFGSNIKIALGITTVPVGVVSAAVLGALGLIVFDFKGGYLASAASGVSAYGFYLLAKAGAADAIEEIDNRRSLSKSEETTAKMRFHKSSIDRVVGI